MELLSPEHVHLMRKALASLNPNQSRNIAASADTLTALLDAYEWAKANGYQQEVN